MATTTAYEVETLTVQYSTTLQLLLQQINNRLRGAVASGTYVGKMASPVQYIGPLQFKQAGQRGSPLQPQIAQYQRRWITPKDFDLPVQVDTFDELRTIVDPRSGLVADINAAANRAFDDLIIAAFFGTAQTGVDGTSLTTETFNSGADFPVAVVVADTFGVGQATGMTVKKLIEARRILRKYENDMEGIRVHMALGSQQEADLLNDIQVTSREYSNQLVLESGHIRSFLGTEFHFSERLQMDSGNAYRRCPVWLEDGMHLGVWKDIETVISQRNDLSGHPWQAYAMVSANATRLQAGKVVEVDCLDGSGSDINP